MALSDEWTGPWIQAAAFCETVIEGKDGVLSLIRLIDVVTVQEPLPDAPDLHPVTPMTMIITLKSGDFRGDAEVQIIAQRPDGSQEAAPVQTVALTGDERGANIRVDVLLGVQVPGLTWFDIRVNGRTLTRVPLRLVIPEQFSPGEAMDESLPEETTS